VSLGVQPGEVTGLPPLPPASILDVRVAVDGIEPWQVPWAAPGTAYPVHLQGCDMTLGWEIPPGVEGQWELRLGDESYALAGAQVVFPGDTAPGIELRQLGETILPQAFSLAQNHPNPFNPETTIRFSPPRSQRVALDVYSVAGQKVATLLHGQRAAGRHSVRWDATDDHGGQLASGVYLYRLSSADDVETRKLVLMR
jgi:hypothetical protein